MGNPICNGSGKFSPMMIDARGLKCPLPVLKLEKAAADLSAGAHIVVLATDPVARIDIPHFCRANGHGCEVTSLEDGLRFEITLESARQN